MAWHGVACRAVPWRGMAWHGVACRAVPWRGMAWHGVAWPMSTAMLSRAASSVHARRARRNTPATPVASAASLGNRGRGQVGPRQRVQDAEGGEVHVEELVVGVVRGLCDQEPQPPERLPQVVAAVGDRHGHDTQAAKRQDHEEVPGDQRRDEQHGPVVPNDKVQDAEVAALEGAGGLPLVVQLVVAVEARQVEQAVAPPGPELVGDHYGG
mmetsp:Transcript_121382/g.377749  ORF Transcript_121382/g.377749 Transcript_121382/m.377749 type:complete len:211 (-) Transcript_121382:390-1022(-)